MYGFITIRHSLLLQLMDHPWFQRLRRIGQLGLSHLVYPGALHNRFQHAIGAMHLMQNAVDELRIRGIEITDDEELGLLCAVLLHDIGHGPFSHALEYSLATGLHHEHISLQMMKALNREMNGQLDTALKIFGNEYHKKFMHELVSSQLDMDRLDYLARDSFFSGVVEGQVGSERLIKMLDVVNDRLVVEEKGIYSIEKFIVARRFMYWQVYLHKTVLSAEFMLLKALHRARALALQGVDLFASPSLKYFLYEEVTVRDGEMPAMALEQYARLDDFDIAGAIKVWQLHPDKVLSELCTRLMHRRLFKIEVHREPIDVQRIEECRNRVASKMELSDDDVRYFVINDKVDNRAYSSEKNAIGIKMKDGRILDAAEVSDHLNLAALSKPVEKFFLAYPV